MEKPMVYLEEGGWGLTCGDDEDNEVWVEPGWYEVALVGRKCLFRDLNMLDVKEDTELTYQEALWFRLWGDEDTSGPPATTTPLGCD